MANTISVLNPENWRPIVQDFLNNILVATDIANTQFRAELVDGDTINFPQMTDVRVQDYAQGTDLTIDALNAAQSQLLIDKSKAVAIPIDPVQEKQAKAKFALQMAKQSAFRLANQIDKDLIAAGISAAYSSITGGSLNTALMFSTFSDARAKLFRQNATDGSLFAVVDAERIALLSQSFVANGFSMADYSLRNQFVGECNGFKVYASNNLPCAVTLTMATQPTAGDYFYLYGVKWTWTAAASATAAGDIAIGGDLAAAKVNLVLAITGTATPSAATYIDISADNRKIYQNNDVAAATFSTHDCAITSTGKSRGVTSDSWTSANNYFGTESTSLLFGKVGALSLGMQMQPNLYIREEPKQLARNYITHTLYGVKVFSKDEYRLCKVTCNA